MEHAPVRVLVKPDIPKELLALMDGVFRHASGTANCQVA